MKPINSSFKIENPFCEYINFKANPNFKPSTETIPLEADIKIETNKNFKEKTAIVSIIVNIFKNGKGPFSIEVKYTGTFKISENMSEDTFNKLCEINGPAILLPYVRSIISTITAESGFPPLLLPLINLKETFKK